MSQLTREAWRAYFKGNYLRAGDLYKAAGELDKSLKMYVKAGNLRAAAEVEEMAGRVSGAVDLLMRAGDPNSASELLGRHGQYARASQILAEAGNRAQAAAMALKGGLHLQAAQYFEQSGRFMEAGRLSFRAGHLPKAMLLFEKALKQAPSMDALTASEQLQNRELLAEIARYFEQGGAYARAAEVHEQLNNILQAAQCWEADRQFTRAMELYHRAGAMDRVRALADRTEDTPLAIRAEALAARGETEEAALLFAQAGDKERAATLMEGDGNMAGAAELRREMGDFELAGNLFYRIQAYLPAAESFQHAQLHNLAKQCYLKAGDLASACRMAYEAGEWEESVELAATHDDKQTLLQRLQTLPAEAGGSARVNLLKSRLFLDLGEPKLALTCLEGVPPQPGREELWRLYVTGRAQEALGGTDEASDCYHRVLALDMAFLDTRERLDTLTPEKHPARAVPEVRYQREEMLWEDSSGRWFRGRDSQMESPVLLNVDDGRCGSASLIQDKEVLQRVMDLQHPSVLALRDVVRGTVETTLVHEGFGGRPLADWLKEGYRPALYAALDKTRQVLEALDEAHGRRLIHGHLSPSAVLMDKDGRVKVRGFGKITDFEALRGWIQRETLTPYMAPETAFDRVLAASCDIYAAGAILLHLLTGQVPAGHLTRGGRQPEAESDLFKGVDLPGPVKDLALKLMATEPRDRFARAEEALRDLAALELPQGSVIAGRYEILDELGRGGMGQVFRVRDRELDEIVALKTLRKRADLTEAARIRFLREIKLTRKITHPNVVRVFDLGTWRDLTFLTMEYIPGRTLSQWVRDAEGRQATLRWKVEILRSVADGLSEAHKLGIVHRDLKPQNVILTPGGIPKLLDFGIAYTEVHQDADLTDEGRFVGSPKYVSPEQIQGEALDSRSDIYCFGLLAYFLLTGQDAFSGDNATLILLKQLKEQPVAPSRIVRLPASLENLVLWCLKKNPNERPGSLAEVSKVLKEIV